jgi:ABC-type antimicrobial peptide transport system permease subunit
MISMKSIKMRLGRSIITAAGIFLGIAFLVSVQSQGLVQWPMPPAEGKIRPGFARLDGELEAPGDKSIWKPVTTTEAAAAGVPAEIITRLAGTADTFSLTDLVTALDNLKATRKSLAAAKATVDAYNKLPASITSRPDAEILSSGDLKKAGLPEAEVEMIAAAGSIPVAALKAAKDKATADLMVLEAAERGLAQFDKVPHPAVENLAAAKSITVAELFKIAKPTPGADLTKVMIVGKDRHVKLDLSKDGPASTTKMASGDAVLVLDSASGNRSIWLAIMALLVCTIGITNSMLMSVTERFREIGTMKCLGALDMFVVELFLFESGFLGIISSAIGSIIGLLAILLFAVVGKGAGILGQVAVLDILKVLFSGIGVGCLVTVIAAIAPAVRAAQMPPAAALRTEV